MMKKILLSLAAVTAMTAMADTPLWMRFASISPDGNKIAFCYKGDIYVVPSSGGQAVQLTSQCGRQTAQRWLFPVTVRVTTTSM